MEAQHDSPRDEVRQVGARPPRLFRALDPTTVFGPPTPLALALARALGSPTGGLRPGLAAALASRGGFDRRLLEFVDGAPFRPARLRSPFGSLEHARSVLGSGPLGTLALALALPFTPPAELGVRITPPAGPGVRITPPAGPGVRAFDGEAWQRHNLRTATAAFLLARTGSAHLAEEAFLLGLLDRAGVPLLAACLPDEYPSWYAALPLGADVARLEREEWGWSQADAAREALADWRLPERLWRALAGAEVDAGARLQSARERELAGLLVTARALVRAIETNACGPALCVLDARTRARGLTTARRDALLGTVAATSASLFRRTISGRGAASDGQHANKPRPAGEAPRGGQLPLLDDLLDALWHDEPPLATELLVFRAEPHASPPWNTLRLALSSPPSASSRGHALSASDLRWASWEHGIAAVLRRASPSTATLAREDLEQRLAELLRHAGPGSPVGALADLRFGAAASPGPTSRAESRDLLARAVRSLELRRAG